MSFNRRTIRISSCASNSEESKDQETTERLVDAASQYPGCGYARRTEKHRRRQYVWLGRSKPTEDVTDISSTPKRRPKDHGRS